MLMVRTLSVFLPSLRSSSIVCANAGPADRPNTVASKQSFFMSVLRWLFSASTPRHRSGVELLDPILANFQPLRRGRTPPQGELPARPMDGLQYRTFPGMRGNCYNAGCAGRSDFTRTHSASR